MNRIQEGMQVLGSALHIPADPVCAGLIHLTWIYLEVCYVHLDTLLSESGLIACVPF